jgi:hypothetical protein
MHLRLHIRASAGLKDFGGLMCTPSPIGYVWLSLIVLLQSSVILGHGWSLGDRIPNLSLYSGISCFQFFLLKIGIIPTICEFCHYRPRFDSRHYQKKK